MNRLVIFLIALFFLNNCSLNENSRLWENKVKKPETKNNIKKAFLKDKKKINEFNPELKLDLTNLKSNNKIIDTKNNFGSQNYDGKLNKLGNYKFSKLEDINQLNFTPLFLNDGLIFFDKKGSIVRYNNLKKVLWKTNHYSKFEKKLKPKLNFALNNDNLIITDSVARYYQIIII